MDFSQGLFPQLRPSLWDRLFNRSPRTAPPPQSSSFRKGGKARHPPAHSQLLHLWVVHQVGGLWRERKDVADSAELNHPVSRSESSPGARPAFLGCPRDEGDHPSHSPLPRQEALGPWRQPVPRRGRLTDPRSPQPAGQLKTNRRAHARTLPPPQQSRAPPAPHSPCS